MIPSFIEKACIRRKMTEPSILFKVKVMTIKQLLQSVQDDARPVKGIQFHLAQLSLRGRDIAGTCGVIFVIVILVVYILCDIISIYLQNICIYCRRFLTYFFPENIGSSPVEWPSTIYLEIFHSPQNMQITSRKTHTTITNLC